MNRILVVEDEAEIRKIVKEFLTKNGFDVTCVSVGTEAIKIISSGEKVDLIILDVKMPKMNGFDCLKGIRRENPEIPAVFLTGSVDKARHADVLKELGCGYDDMLQKPIDLYKLLEQIKKRIGG